MNRQHLKKLGILLMLALVACTPVPGAIGEPVNNPLAGGEWQLASFGDPENPQTGVAGHLPTIIFGAEEVRGSGGCNGYGGAYTVEASRIQMNEVAMTEMACMEPGVMEQESAFIRILTAVEEFVLEEKALTVRGPEGFLQFVPPAPVESQPLENTLWHLQQFVSSEGDAVSAMAPLETFPITAWFEDGQLSGSTGCNGYGVPYTLDGERIALSPEFAMTQALCGDEPANDQESRFVEAVQTGESFRISGDILTLIYPGGELVFSFQPDPGTDESAVHTAVLSDWGEGPFVIRDQTVFNGPGISLEDTLEGVQSQLDTFNPDDPFTLQPDTLADFQAKNAQPASLGESLQSRFSIIILTDAEIQERFMVDGDIDWVAFREAFPGADGIYTLSRVGFNQAGDHALVYLGLESESHTAGWHSLMVKNNNQWGATTSFLIWQK